MKIYFVHNRFVLTFLVFLAFFYARAQQETVPYLQDTWRIYDGIIHNKSFNTQTSFKPITAQALKVGIQNDSIFTFKTNGIWGILNGGGIDTTENSDKNDTSSKKEMYLSLSPIFSLQAGYEKTDSLDNTIYGSGIGLTLDASLGNKLFAHVEYFTENSGFPSWVENYIQQNKVVPSMGYAHGTKLGHSYSQVTGYISYAPVKVFNFQAGMGNHFIGDGYRSLFLSDNSAPYPYIRVTTSIWKVQYTNLYSAMKDISQYDENNKSTIKYKYSSIHHLSWNATKWLNIGFFEAITWQAKDTLLNRGYDVNYLNPIIFYRPVEYSLGSPDNAFMGLNTKVRITKSFQLYSQFLLDEFLLDNFKSGSGWWANKFGIQAGVKWFDVAGIKDLQWQIEGNVVRPYTYSHGAVMQNYSNMGQAIAHPVGANFKELLSVISYRRNKLLIHDMMSYYNIGVDSGGYSMGGDIFQPYTNRPPNRDNGNYIGQGELKTVLYNELSAEYLLLSGSQMFLGVHYIYRKENSASLKNSTNYVMISFRTVLKNRYTDY